MGLLLVGQVLDFAPVVNLTGSILMVLGLIVLAFTWKSVSRSNTEGGERIIAHPKRLTLAITLAAALTAVTAALVVYVREAGESRHIDFIYLPVGPVQIPTGLTFLTLGWTTAILYGYSYYQNGSAFRAIMRLRANVRFERTGKLYRWVGIATLVTAAVGLPPLSVTVISQIACSIPGACISPNPFELQPPEPYPLAGGLLYGWLPTVRVVGAIGICAALLNVAAGLSGLSSLRLSSLRKS
jgi:hypothetical protein